MSELCADLLERLQKPRNGVNNSPGNSNTKRPSAKKNKTGTDDEVPHRHKIILEVTEESVDEDEKSGEEIEVTKKPKQNHSQVAKNGSESEYEFVYESMSDENDEPVKNKK